MRRLLAALCLLLLVGVSAPARAFVPQTINVDGINDFDPANLLRDDRQDTQSGCAVGVYPMDLGRVYMTNDANFLYIGIEFSKTCYCDMNLGMAFDVGSAAGGVTDPFGRKIGWANVPFKPDWIIYDVPPTNCNTFNYEILYKDSVDVTATHAWFNRSQFINPSWGGGSNGLGIVDSVNFKELKIPLSVFGVTTGTQMHVEFWTTQEGTTKGPLDALFSNNVQMSRANTTTYDTTAVVQMTAMGTYVVQNSVDNIPPTVVQAQAVNFTTLANRQFSVVTNKVDVTFAEPVDPTTSAVAANYTFSGTGGRTVISAQRDPAATSTVHLTLNGVIAASATAYGVTVQNVKDLAGNPIVVNGTTNKGEFFDQNVTFNGDFHIGLCNGTFAPADSFAVEGSLLPLTIGSLCDNGLLYDANVDSIYTLTVPFSLVKSRITGKGEADFEWKFSHKCSEYEPLGSNRAYHLTSDNGATATISAAWNNDDPANFTNKPVDVIFRVNTLLKNPTGARVITLLGGVKPLAFTQPGVAMLDNGVGADQTAGDKIYSVRVTFPVCSPKNVNWKVDYDGTIECSGQGDRNVYLNDALFSSANPIILPARGIDRCTVTDKAIPVTFKVNMDRFDPLPVNSDSVAVMGDALPLRFDLPAAAALMKNDGVAPDAQAGDAIFTRTITFPDSTPTTVNFKYWKAPNTFECVGFGNRQLTLDDTKNSIAVPVVRLVNVWDYCTDPTGVPYTGHTTSGGTAFANLMPVMPNPVSHRASFAFELRKAGRVQLSVYDVSGRRVAKLVDAAMAVGLHNVAWDARTDAGLRLESGVYLYELSLGGERVSRRLILTH